MKNIETSGDEIAAATKLFHPSVAYEADSAKKRNVGTFMQSLNRRKIRETRAFSLDTKKGALQSGFYKRVFEQRKRIADPRQALLQEDWGLVVEMVAAEILHYVFQGRTWIASDAENVMGTTLEELKRIHTSDFKDHFAEHTFDMIVGIPNARDAFVAIDLTLSRERRDGHLGLASAPNFRMQERKAKDIPIPKIVLNLRAEVWAVIVPLFIQLIEQGGSVTPEWITGILETLRQRNLSGTMQRDPIIELLQGKVPSSFSDALERCRGIDLETGLRENIEKIHHRIVKVSEI